MDNNNSPLKAFIKGMGSMFDFSHIRSPYSHTKNPAQADAEALNEDWKKIGDDLRQAIGNYKNQTQKTSKGKNMEENKKSNLKYLIATWFHTGLIKPIIFKGMAGTYGSIFALILCIPLVLLCQGSRIGLYFYYFIGFVIFFLGIWSVPEAEQRLKGKIDWHGIPKDRDQNQIVIDEVMGMLVTFYAFLPPNGPPFTLWSIIIALALFRAFDIIKPPGSRYFDKKQKNRYGVMLDDMVSGTYACIIIILLHRFGFSFFS